MEGDRSNIAMAVIACIVGLAAGAALTIAIQGARDAGRSDDPDAVMAAEPAAEATLTARAPAPRPARRTSMAGEQADPEALEEEIAELEQELDRLRVEAAMAKGQLSHYEGDPQPWPDDVPEGFMPTAFESAVTEALAGREDAELLDVDCAEFPCIAVIRSYSGEPDWHQGLHESIPDPEGYDGEVGKMVFATESAGAGARARLLSVAMVPEDHAEDGLRERVDFRVNTLTEEVAEEVLGEGG